MQFGDPAEQEHRQFSADADGHFFAYRASELVEIFRGAPLSKVRVQYFETPWISGHMKLRYLHSWVPTHLLRWLDGVTLRIPGIGERLAHQLLIVGERP